MKNVDFSRLGTMLQLDIQKGKGSIRTPNFQKHIGGTAACMKRLAMAKKGCVQLKSNGTYFDDSWFSGVKISEEGMDEGVDYCGPVKMIHEDFCLDKLENLTKDWPGG